MRSIERVRLGRRSKQVLEVLSLQDTELLPTCQSAFTFIWSALYAYWAKGNRGSGQANEAAIPGVGLVDCIGVFVTELVDNLGYPVMILCSERISDEAFELESASFALVVELIIQRLGDIDIHVQCRAAASTWRGGAAIAGVRYGAGRGYVQRCGETGQRFGAVVLYLRSNSVI